MLRPRETGDSALTLGREILLFVVINRFFGYKVGEAIN